MSVHEEQLREPECPAELGSKSGLKWDPKPSSHLTPAEVGGGIPCVWWRCLSQLVGDRQWHCCTGKFPRGIWHWDQFQQELGHHAPP